MSLPPDPQPRFVVEIGPKEIYDAVLRLQAIVLGQGSKQDEHAKDIADHEMRLRAQEARRWPLPTAVALFAAASLVVAVIALVWRR